MAEPKEAKTQDVAPTPESVVETSTTEASPVESAPVGTAEPEAPVAVEPAPQVIVVDAPVAPRPKGNRVAGILFSLLATVIYAILFSVAYVATNIAFGVGFDLTFITSLEFLFPTALFFVGMVLIVLILNRAGWWSHIFGSVIVGLIVLFGTASLLLVSAGMLTMTQQQANLFFYSALLQPTTIVAALLAREVAIWTGAVIARRGRKVKARNVEAHEKFERDQAELIPTS
jgi:hypothetical protein